MIQGTSGTMYERHEVNLSAATSVECFHETASVGDEYITVKNRTDTGHGVAQRHASR